MAETLKIAVQFFGHLRTYKRCMPSIQKHLLSKYDCDVFMHTWSETDSKTATWHNYNKQKASRITEAMIEDLRQNYNLKDIAVEDQLPNKKETELISCLHNEGKSQISILGLNFMLYSQKKVNELRKKYQKKHNVLYDYVLMIRPDILLKKDFVLEDVSHEIRMTDMPRARFSAVNISSNKTFPLIGECSSDILYFGTPETMDEIITTLNNIDFKKEKKTFWNPETCFNQALLKNNIPSYFIRYPYGSCWEIVRPLVGKALRRKLIKLKITPRLFKLNLLEILPWNIVSLQFSILSHINIEISLGAVYEK